jgi:hypothetical protein
MKFYLTVLLLFSASLCPTEAKGGENKSDLKLTLTSIANTDGTHTLRLLLENIGNKHIRVVNPSFSPFRYYPHTQSGGYGLTFLDKKGKPIDFDWSLVPEAARMPVWIDGTVVLRPGMSVGNRIMFKAQFIAKSQISRVIANYEILSADMEASISKQKGSNLKHPLWKGKISSAPFSLVPKSNSSNKEIQTKSD